MAATTAAEAQALLAAANCDMCYASPGQIWYEILAALIHVGNGETVPDAPTLASEIQCLECYITPGMLPYAILQAIRGISSGGGSGGGLTCGAGAPVAAPASGCGGYINTNDGSLFLYYSGAWH
mgnify:CR=1 FL=1